MTTVLLTNSWLRSSYAALRNLSDHNIPVCAADSHRMGMCRASRRTAGFFHHRSHYADETGFVQDVADICTGNDIGLILPSHNETEILARHRAQLPDGVDAILPDAKGCALFNDKTLGYEFVRGLGIPVPKTITCSGFDELSDGLSDLKAGRYVIKLRKGNSSKGVFYANSPEQTVRTVKTMIRDFDLPPDRWPQVEEHVPGEGWGCSALYWHGAPVAFFTHRRIREKIATGGTSTLREAAINTVLQQAARRILDAAGWHGLAMCEFKFCPETGRFWFIEVNPRMWGSMPLAISAGVEFPYLAWLCAEKGAEEARAYHSNAVLRHPWRGRWLLGDISVGMQAFFSGRWPTAYQTLFNARADALDDFFPDDPLVFFGEAGVYLENAVLGRSLNPTEKGMIG